MLRDAARSYATDRYLAALLAPKAVRADLIALAAFFGDLARIPLTVSDPLIGEIRLQWWRDALSAIRAREATGNPLADAFAEAVERHELPDALLLEVIDGYSVELGTDTTDEPSEERLIASERAAFELVARVIGVHVMPNVKHLLEAAAQSYGRVRFLRVLPLLRRNGRVPQILPVAGQEQGRDSSVANVCSTARLSLQEARTLARSAPSALLPAILPLALVGPYLAALDSQGVGHEGEIVDIAPLTRVWRLWSAKTLGRV